jgi:hypothetical protein
MLPVSDFRSWISRLDFAQEHTSLCAAEVSLLDEEVLRCPSSGALEFASDALAMPFPADVLSPEATWLER